jgi:hypothetical protein
MVLCTDIEFRAELRPGKGGEQGEIPRKKGTERRERKWIGKIKSGGRGLKIDFTTFFNQS